MLCLDPPQLTELPNTLESNTRQIRNHVPESTLLEVRNVKSSIPCQKVILPWCFNSSLTLVSVISAHVSYQ